MRFFIVQMSNAQNACEYIVAEFMSAVDDDDFEAAEVFFVQKTKHF